MSLTRIDLDLPEDLVRRAEAVGVKLDDVTADILALVEKRIAKKEAVRELLQIMDELSQIPAEEKPSEEEIIEEIRQYRREQAAQHDANVER